MPIEIINVLVAFIGNIFLSLFTVFKNPKSTTNKLFFLLTLSISVYLLFNYFVSHQTTDSAAFFWVKMVMSIAVFINLFFFLLASTFPQQKLQLKPIIFWLAVGLTLLVVPLAQLGLIFKNAKASGEAGQPGIAMPVFLLHTVILLGMGIVILIRKLRKASGIEKLQIRLFLLGAVFMFISILVTNLLFVLIFKTTAFINLLPIYTLVFVGFISYAIIKHRFLDIGLIVARSVSFALLTGLLALLYALFFGALSSVFTRSVIEIKTLTVSTILALIMAFSFQPFRRILEKISDRVFYKGGYDSNQLLSRLGSIMSTNIELRPLTTQIIEVLIRQMRISKGAFVILGEGATSVYDVVDVGFAKKLNLFYSQISAFLSFPQTIAFDELEENNLKNQMREMGISVIKTLRVKGSVVGLVLLGEKASGGIYSEQDLKMLEILAPEVAVAIQNSQSYDKIKKFNVILSQEVKRATVDLEEANRRLKQLDQLKDDFVSIASHELRTPMTAIRSYAWMALHRSDIPLSQSLEKYLSRVLISTERLINLVNDMLNVSRIESGKVEIKPEVFNMVELVDDVMTEVGPKCSEKQIHLQFAKDKVPPVFADKDKIHQVLLNLIGNSMKFTPASGTITVRFFTDGKVLETSIQDNGVGISKEDLSRLFQKFSRLDNSYVAAATSGGTGLGLYISKNLVNLMHGKIWASSEGTGKGANFTFSLPVASKEVLDQAAKYTHTVQGESKQLEPVAI